jgi:hypothetical protein
MIRVALCLRGAVSKRDRESKFRGDIYDSSLGYVNFRAVYNSLKKHIFEANPDAEIDVFLQSWSEDLQGELESLYDPVASLFENNESYADDIIKRCHGASSFSGVSQALAISKSIQLKELHESFQGLLYDIVILYRPDVLLWKDMILSEYDVSQGVFVNAHGGRNGDFHFVMSSGDASSFKGLYDSPLHGNPHRVHFWIRNFVENHMGRKMIMDGIVPGRDQEVIRPHKMRAGPIGLHRIDPQFFSRYGVTKEYILND